MATSQNGWPAFDAYGHSSIVPLVVNGTPFRPGILKGDVREIFEFLIGWLDKNIEPAKLGADDWSFTPRAIRGKENGAGASATAMSTSNHASGTAIDYNAQLHPMGKRGTYTKDQTSRIRQHLKFYDGAIRWGGDYTGRADEMHFEINQGPTEVALIAKKIRALKAAPVVLAPIVNAIVTGEITVADTPTILARIEQVVVWMDENRKADIARQDQIVEWQNHRFNELTRMLGFQPSPTQVPEPGK